MALEGLHAVQSRIVEIQRRAGVVQAPVRGTGAAGTAEFDQVLSEALERGAGANHTHAHGAGHANAAKRTGKLEPPPELARFGNGRIPAEALAPIGRGNHRLWAPAAKAFQRMEADAAAAGVRIGVTDSYRSYEGQVDVARRKGLYKNGGLAATPGTSNHGWGLSLDLDLDPAAQRWMRANASRYGFVEDVPREPWHWTYRATP